MSNLDQAAKEIFQILKTYNYTVQLFDKDGGAVEEVEDARRMFSKSKNVLVTIVDENENSSIDLHIGSDIDINSIEGLIQSMRTCCTKFNLNFHIQRYGKEINPKAELSETTRGNTMDIFEGMYGTSKSSYLKMENARLIVKHSKKVDESKHGSRGRFIESIFIENAKGERMLFPTNNLLPARAMTTHVNMGGGFADQVAKQIFRMAGDFQNLASCSQHVFNNGAALPEGATTVREACKKKMSTMRKTFEKMSRPNGYTIEAAKIIEMANALIEGKEDEDVVDQDKIDEVRSLISLEGVQLSDELIESVCKAMKDNELEEAQGRRDIGLSDTNSVSVLGRKVNSQAWAELAAGKIKLNHTISNNFNSDEESDDEEKDARSLGYTGDGIKYTSKTSEVVHKLQSIVPTIEDDSLMNLMSYVVDTLSDPDKSRKENPESVMKMKKLAMYVLKAAEGSSDVPSKVPAVVEYFNWFSKLSTKSVLNEYGDYRGLPPSHLMGHNPYDDEIDDDPRIKDTIDDFDVEDFCETYLKENGLDDESIDPADRTVEKDDLLDSIELKLLSMFSEREDTNPPSEMKSEAEEVLPKVIDYFEIKGIVVNQDVDEDDDENYDPFSDDETSDNVDLKNTLKALGGSPDDLNEFYSPKKKSPYEEDLNDLDLSDVEFTDSDIMLPAKNQGDGLAREVCKRKIRSPSDGKERDPSDGYIQQLRTLAGINNPNPQTY